MPHNAANTYDVNGQRPPNSHTIPLAKTTLLAKRRTSRGRGGLMLLFFLVLASVGGVVCTLIPASSAIIALLVFLSGHMYAYRVSPQAFNILLPVFAIRLLEMVAAIFLNTGVPLPEIGLFSHASSSFFWQALLYSTWPILFAWFFPRIADLGKAQSIASIYSNSSSQVWFTILAFAYGIIILGFYAIYGAPLFYQYGKYAFYTSAGSRVLVSLVRYRLGMVCLVGYLAVVSRSRVLRMALFVLYAALFVLGADKLTAPVLALSFGLIPLCMIRPRAIFNPKIVLLGAFCIGAAFTIYFGGRAALARSSDVAWDSILVRLPAQSQMWYVVSEAAPPIIDLPSPQSEQELQSLLPFGDSEEQTQLLGQNKILKDLASAETYKKMVGGGSFIMILYPYIMKYYGVISLIILNFVFIAYYLILSSALVRALASMRPAMVLIIGLLLQGLVLSFVTGNLSTALGTNIYFLFVIGFFLYIIKGLSEKRRKLHV